MREASSLPPWQLGPRPGRLGPPITTPPAGNRCLTHLATTKYPVGVIEGCPWF